MLSGEGIAVDGNIQKIIPGHNTIRGFQLLPIAISASIP
jgi:hypothetical protein